ncbi:polysaccharide pyruvyl transferase family protein [Pseudocolwellia sp. HL-MZ7]|uniref:polysaccharide pyruvyl transferase family protein n=1 Tax=Pseudocolwellia sp. HL-MZ7 TaxID=3400627 RepID=UPI003CE766C9
MNDIILYGAFDRHNYGDLLFPLIMERVINDLHPKKKVLIAGLINSNLSKYGARKTITIKKALKMSKNDATLILAGGDVVACDWQSAYGYLLPKSLFPLYERIACYYFPKFTQYITSRLVGLTSDLPFNLSRNDMGTSRKVIYNSVGATGVSNVTKEQDVNALCELMNETDFVSVRDKFSQSQLERVGCSTPNLAPDSATIMSSYITIDELEQKSSFATKDLIETHIEGYIVFQISQGHVRGKEKAFAEALSQTSKAFNLPIVFIAIGNAAGHNDVTGVHKVASLLTKGTTYSTYLDGNIFDLMNIIRNASCYCGTSLHGLITSMSFSVPRVALLPTLRKQINYMNTWDLPHMPKGVMPEDLSEAVGIAMTTPSKDLKSLGQKLTDTYMSNFKSMSSSF